MDWTPDNVPGPIPPTRGFLHRNRVYLGLAGLAFIIVGLARFLIWFAAQREVANG